MSDVKIGRGRYFKRVCHKNGEKSWDYLCVKIELQYGILCRNGIDISEGVL